MRMQDHPGRGASDVSHVVRKKVRSWATLHIFLVGLGYIIGGHVPFLPSAVPLYTHAVCEMVLFSSPLQTNVGNVLLSVNPYKKLLIYSPEVIDVYRCHCLHQLPPHMCVRFQLSWGALHKIGRFETYGRYVLKTTYFM